MPDLGVTSPCLSIFAQSSPILSFRIDLKACVAYTLDRSFTIALPNTSTLHILQHVLLISKGSR